MSAAALRQMQTGRLLIKFFLLDMVQGKSYTEKEVRFRTLKKKGEMEYAAINPSAADPAEPFI